MLRGGVEGGAGKQGRGKGGGGGGVRRGALQGEGHCRGGEERGGREQRLFVVDTLSAKCEFACF